MDNIYIKSLEVPMVSRNGRIYQSSSVPGTSGLVAASSNIDWASATLDLVTIDRDLHVTGNITASGDVVSYIASAVGSDVLSGLSASKPLNKNSNSNIELLYDAAQFQLLGGALQIKPDILTPAIHNQDISTINGLQTALDLKLATSLKGSINGLAELDANGFVKNTQLPSYVDHILEFNSAANLPITGEISKIYITIDDNKTYRWSGTGYAEISASLALGETSATAYRGDRGAIAYAKTAPLIVTSTKVTIDRDLEVTGNITASKDVISYISGAVTSDVLASLSGVAPLWKPTSSTVGIKLDAAQFQVNALNELQIKVGTIQPSGNYIIEGDARLSNARVASDVYAWAKASAKPSYTKSEVGLNLADNTADSTKSVSYAATSGTATNWSGSGTLSNYLPLAGGTLTGGLNGASAAFTGAVTATQFSGSGYPYYSIFGSGADVTTTKLWAGSATSINLYGQTHATPNIVTFSTASIERLRIDATGNATFQVGVVSPGVYVFGYDPSEPFLQIKSTYNNTVYQIGTGKVGAGYNGLTIRNNTVGINLLHFDASYNATFSNSVTAASIIAPLYTIRNAAGVPQWTVSVGATERLEFKNASGVTEMVLTQAGEIHAKTEINAYSNTI